MDIDEQKKARGRRAKKAGRTYEGQNQYEYEKSENDAREDVKGLAEVQRAKKGLMRSLFGPKVQDSATHDIFTQKRRPKKKPPKDSAKYNLFTGEERK